MFCTHTTAASFLLFCRAHTPHGEYMRRFGAPCWHRSHAPTLCACLSRERENPSAVAIYSRYCVCCAILPTYSCLLKFVKPATTRRAGKRQRAAHNLQPWVSRRAPSEVQPQPAATRRARPRLTTAGKVLVLCVRVVVASQRGCPCRVCSRQPPRERDRV